MLQINSVHSLVLFPDTVNQKCVFCKSQRNQPRPAALTFPVQPSELLLELLDEAADGGADGSQVDVGVDADRRPVGGLGRGWQRRQVLQEIEEARLNYHASGEIKSLQ